jgi:16S rRNA (cytidine1402-2'-O)-methyltransferase
MGLTLVAVPIGNHKDISLRALETLQQADITIGEERKPLFRLYKQLEIGRPKDFRLLNEHSEDHEINELVTLCAQHNVALVTDCGTPGFSDPGAELVHKCRSQNIAVTSNPGASSLTTFLSLCGVKLTKFQFQGFLPRESLERENYIKSLQNISLPTIIMDTPYRLQKTLLQLSQWIPQRKIVVGMDLTKDSELVLAGTAQEVAQSYSGEKKEFLILIV